MKNTRNFIYLSLMAFALLFTACRTEDEELINPDNEQNSTVDARAANLIIRTAANDGSGDNILDNASCFSIVLPVTVFIDGLEIIVDSEEDFQTIEDVFDEFDGDIDELDFLYPITIVLADFTEVVINNEDELVEYAAQCPDSDDDIECIDFQYPITYSIFNEDSELIDTVTVNSDAEHYAFIDDIEDSDIVSVNFPLTLVLSDGSTVIVNNIIQLEEAIENAIDDCDEDDDNDYDDDDCENCTIDQLTEAFTGCDSFEVHKLKRNGDDLDVEYEDFRFTFYSDGTLVANNGNENFAGLWIATGVGQNITVEIEVAGQPDFNDNWNLHEISAQDEQVKIDLRLPNGDRLRFKCDSNDGENDDCEDCTEEQLDAAVTGCDIFTIEYFFQDNQDLTDSFDRFELNFLENGMLTGENNNASGNPLTGAWSSFESGNDLIFEMAVDMWPQLTEAWIVLDIDVDDDETKIELAFGNDRLTLVCDPENDGVNTLSDILMDDEWVVALFENDGNNETGIYSDFTFDFDDDNEVEADNGSTEELGVWIVTGTDTVFELSFDNAPLVDLTDGYEVISIANDRVELSNSSKTLVFEKE